MARFIDELMAGNVTPDDLDDFVDEWHATPSSSVPLHEFLGLSLNEWGVVFREPAALRFVVEARRAGVETVFPLIIDCACGRDHESMPRDVEVDEDGNKWEVELVCVTHKRHIPCRRCRPVLKDWERELLNDN